MIRVLDQQENYLLVTNGSRFTVVERRAGNFYSLCAGRRRGVSLDDDGVAEIIQEAGSYSEREARQLLAEVATRCRDLWDQFY